MKLQMTYTTAIAAAFVLAGCQSAPVDTAAQEQALVAAGWQPLDSSGTVSAFADTTHAGTDKKHGPWAVYYSPDGSMRGQSGEYSDVGTYSVSEDGVFCRKWTKWREGQEGCARYFQRGNELTNFNVSGNTKGGDTWTYEPGNTRSL